MKQGFRITHASQFSVPAGANASAAAYSAITICQLLAFSTVWEPEVRICTPQTQQAKEQVKTECAQTQECERWIGKNPIFKIKHKGLVGV